MGVERRRVGRGLVVNVLGTRRLIEAAAPTLIANGKDAHGRVVAVASAAGRTGLYHLAAYSAAKHAVVGLIRGTAMDLAPYGVTANAVSPGSTRTALLDASAQVYELSSAEEFAQQQPSTDSSNRWKLPPRFRGCARRPRQRSRVPTSRSTEA